MAAKPHKMFIGGKWVDAADGKTFEDMNPYSREVYAHLTAWEQRMLAIIRSIITGAPHPQYASAPEFNDYVFHANKDRSLEEVQRILSDRTTKRLPWCSN